MSATDASSLMRFDTHGLLHTLRHRRAMRREAAARYGYNSVEHRGYLRSLNTVVVELQSRGVAIPDAGAELSCSCAG